MKRRLFSLLLVMILVVSMTLPVSAATPRITLITLGLEFEDTTAICTLHVRSHELTDTISATIKLYRGSTCVRTWTCSDTTYLTFYKEVAAVRNAEYTLEAVVTINGVTEPAVTRTMTCE